MPVDAGDFYWDLGVDAHYVQFVVHGEPSPSTTLVNLYMGE